VKGSTFNWSRRPTLHLWRHFSRKPGLWRDKKNRLWSAHSASLSDLDYSRWLTSAVGDKGISPTEAQTKYQ